MPTYVAFLRAINLGRVRRMAMADLRAWLTEDGYADVATHLATGNVLLRTATRTPRRLEERLEDLLTERAGFGVEVLVRTPSEVGTVVADAASLPTPVVGPDVVQQVLLLRDVPDPEVAALLEQRSGPRAAARVRDRVIHLWLADGVAGDPLGFGRAGARLPTSTMRSRKVLEDVWTKWG